MRFTEVTAELAENWVMLLKFRVMSCWASPRPVFQEAWPAPGTTPEARMLSVATGGTVAEALRPPRVVLAVSRLPSGLKATSPDMISPLVPPGLTMSVGGSARTSACHRLGVVPSLRKSITMFRWPPLESDTGTVMEKSGLMAPAVPGLTA